MKRFNNFVDEMIKIVNWGLKKNLINEKWEVQKKMLSPLIASDKKEIEDYRQKINKGLDEVINSDIKLDYDNDQIISPPWGYELNIEKYIDYLKKGIDAFYEN